MVELLLTGVKGGGGGGVWREGKECEGRGRGVKGGRGGGWLKTIIIISPVKLFCKKVLENFRWQARMQVMQKQR